MNLLIFRSINDIRVSKILSASFTDTRDGERESEVEDIDEDSGVVGTLSRALLRDVDLVDLREFEESEADLDLAREALDLERWLACAFRVDADVFGYNTHHY
jgi:hypothetical protein